jgi:hypothetical protein
LQVNAIARCITTDQYIQLGNKLLVIVEFSLRRY